MSSLLFKKKVVNASKKSCRIFGALAANSNCLDTATIPARGLLNGQKGKKVYITPYCTT